MAKGDYGPKDEAIIASSARFIAECPTLPMCGAAWRMAFEAGMEYAEGRQELVREKYDARLAHAVVCEDARDFVLGLVSEAKQRGLTEDGRTLTTAGHVALGED